jgi:hypothetical protein
MVADQTETRDILDLIFDGTPTLMHMLRVVQTFALGNDDMCRFGRWKDARCESPKNPPPIERVCASTSLPRPSALQLLVALPSPSVRCGKRTLPPSDESTYSSVVFQYRIGKHGFCPRISGDTSALLHWLLRYGQKITKIHAQELYKDTKLT